MEAVKRRAMRHCAPEAEAGREAALLEQALRQRGLCCVEEARLLRRYLEHCGCSQAECARQLGRSQSSVANRLRLLRLPEEVLDTLEAGRITERHGRALLRLPERETQRRALEEILRRSLSVAETESYVESLLSPPKVQSPAPSPEDGFLRAIHGALDALRESGMECEMTCRETAEALVITVTVHKKQRA